MSAFKFLAQSSAIKHMNSTQYHLIDGAARDNNLLSLARKLGELFSFLRIESFLKKILEEERYHSKYKKNYDIESQEIIYAEECRLAHCSIYEFTGQRDYNINWINVFGEIPRRLLAYITKTFIEGISNTFASFLSLTEVLHGATRNIYFCTYII